MTRLCSITIYIGCLCCLMFVSNTYGQDAFLDSMRGTMSGEVIEITEQKPIEGVSVKIVNAADGHEYIVTTDKEGRYEQTGLPAGRYTISVSKNGYGDRIGKSKVVVPGGEVFDRIKMRKKENIITFIQSQPIVWLLVGGLAVIIIAAFVVLLIDLRKPRY